MKSQFKAFEFLKSYPESMADVYYDNTAVDEAVKAIILLSKNKGCGHIWHIMNPHLKKLSEIIDGDVLSDDEFSAKLLDNASNPNVAILSIYYKMNQDGFNPNFDLIMTLKELSKLGFDWTE